MLDAQQLIREAEAIHVEVYMPETAENFKELMAKQIGRSKDGCFYIGEVEKMKRTMDIYHCFSATVIADYDSGSFIGNQDDIKHSRQNLETLLKIKLVDVPETR